MKRAFVAIATGTALLASVASAQDGEQTAPAPQGAILSVDENITVVAGGYAIPKERVNNFKVLCPGNPLRQQYNKTVQEGGAIAVLLYQPPAAKAETLTLYESGLLPPPEEKHTPDSNEGVIDNKGQLRAAYTEKEYVEVIKDAIQTPEASEGAPLRDPNVIKNVRDHAETFCFSVS